MAYNDISKNFTYENGGTIDGDLALTTMAANTKIKNTASGQLYSKRSGFTNVFDKTNTYANYLKADEFGINTSGSGNGVASITYSTSGRKITQNLTTFTTPSDLATANDILKSQAVGSISVSGRTVTYKNVNGQTLGSFQTQDNDTTYSAGSGLGLSGTTFYLALTSSHIINALGYTPAREGAGGGSYNTWYVAGQSLKDSYSSSEIYSYIEHKTNSPHVCTGLGTSEYYSLSGSHPASGTYRCTAESYFSEVNKSSTGQTNRVYFIEVTITKIA